MYMDAFPPCTVNVSLSGRTNADCIGNKRIHWMGWISLLCPLGAISDGKKVRKIPGGRKGCEDKHVGHTAHILCMALSSDGKYLVRSEGAVMYKLWKVVTGCILNVLLPLQASGDRNKLIFIWNAETCEKLHKFQGHRDAVSVSHLLICLRLIRIFFGLCSSVHTSYPHRGSPSRRERTSCSVFLMIVPSRSGTLQRTPT